MGKIKFLINGKSVTGDSGETILSVARREGIIIPTLCNHPDLSVKANCRLCITEIAGRRGFFTACSTPIESGLEVTTVSPALISARKTILELLLGEHQRDCPDCTEQGDCKILRLAAEYGAERERFSNRKSHYKPVSFGPSVTFDPRKCIDCRNCVEACEKQTINHLDIKERGHLFQVIPNADTDCIYCGQCASHCPVGAMHVKNDISRFEALLRDPAKVVVMQIAPAVRVAIGELFGLPPGTNMMGQLVNALKSLGANQVFDVSIGADFTTVEEVNELLERVKNSSRMPMFTSCCPGWVRFVELHARSFLPNLTTVRSPHLILGGLIKTYWAKKAKVEPKNIVVVSVMPCTAKKYEIVRPEIGAPVDLVLTTREVAALLKKNEIDLPKCKEDVTDNPLGIPTEAGVIYGASGGVMESALRSAYRNLTNKKLPAIKFTPHPSSQNIKLGKVPLGHRFLKVAVASGIANARIILEELKQNPTRYDYVEVMACLGGCIGGGGQPSSDTRKRQLRAQGLKLAATNVMKEAIENPIVQQVYEEFFNDEKTKNLITKTKFIN